MSSEVSDEFSMYLRLNDRKRLLSKWNSLNQAWIQNQITHLEPDVREVLTEQGGLYNVPSEMGDPGRVKYTRKIRRESITQTRMVNALKVQLAPHLESLKSPDEISSLVENICKTIWANRSIVSDQLHLERTFSSKRPPGQNGAIRPKRRKGRVQVSGEDIEMAARQMTL